jgi:hypothetical protein
VGGGKGSKAAAGGASEALRLVLSLQQQKKQLARKQNSQSAGPHRYEIARFILFG